MWKPIETAPKGKFILLANGEVDPAYYDTEAKRPPAVVGWSDVGTDELLGEWRFCSFDGGLYGEYENPTHWMEIPYYDLIAPKEE